MFIFKIFKTNNLNIMSLDTVKTKYKASYFDYQVKKMDENKHISPEYLLKLRKGKLDNKVLILRKQLEMAEADKQKVDKELEDLITKQNKDLNPKEHKYFCLCGSIILASRKPCHLKSQRHTRWAKENSSENSYEKI
jgi:hypothetical protein